MKLSLLAIAAAGACAYYLPYAYPAFAPFDTLHHLHLPYPTPRTSPASQGRPRHAQLTPIAANILLARQSIASGLEGALGSAPQACQSACSALLGVADKCQTADQACLTAICQPDVLASYKSCSDCLIKEVGDQLPQSTRQTLEQGQSALGQVCQSSGGAASWVFLL